MTKSTYGTQIFLKSLKRLKHWWMYKVSGSTSSLFSRDNLTWASNFLEKHLLSVKLIRSSKQRWFVSTKKGIATAHSSAKAKNSWSSCPINLRNLRTSRSLCSNSCKLNVVFSLVFTSYQMKTCSKSSVKQRTPSPSTSTLVRFSRVFRSLNSTPTHRMPKDPTSNT